MAASMPTSTDSSASSGQDDARFSRSPPAAADLRTWAVWHLDAQAAACAHLGSPLYAELLRRAADDVRADGPTWDVLAAHASRDPGDAMGLRLMAAVHRLVLTVQRLHWLPTTHRLAAAPGRKAPGTPSGPCWSSTATPSSSW